MRAIDIPELGKLSVPEKIILVEEIWDSITQQEDEIGVPDSHRTELDRRAESHGAAPGRLLSLDELRKRVAQRK